MPLYDIVTVVYDEEVELLALQARSLSLFGRQLSIAKIYIVVNGRNQDSTIERLHSEVLPLYDSRSSQVHIIPGRDLTPYSENAAGWHTQQVIKIAVARIIETTHYVTFDAKNHLVRLIDDGVFFDPEGLPYFCPASARGMTDHFMESARVCGIDGSQCIDWCFPTITPAVLYREHALGLARFIEESRSISIGELICETGAWVTEYMLYFCYLTSQNKFAQLYREGPRMVITLWAKFVKNPELFESFMVDAENGAAPFFSLHRLARPVLTKDQRQRISAYWQRLGLVSDIDDAAYFLGPGSSLQSRLLNWLGTQRSRAGKLWRAAGSTWRQADGSGALRARRAR
jgi:uncharacterized protein DUF6492